MRNAHKRKNESIYVGFGKLKFHKTFALCHSNRLNRVNCAFYAKCAQCILTYSTHTHTQHKTIQFKNI